ncbi:hypothetical protein B0H14DRAFT_2828346 [Mycena olivaceomarginata]|nr:hypothetical protein B0H14DRAFT_2828346 [Mycena olivaceomarginata]
MIIKCHVDPPHRFRILFFPSFLPAPMVDPRSSEFMQRMEVGLFVVVTEVFLYGVYATMFGFYLHVLRKHGVMRNRFLTAATISLFLLCTAHCALLLATTELANLNYDAGDEVYVSLMQALNAIYVTSKCIFRCYAIWNFRWGIVLLPTIMTIIGAGIGYFNVAAITSFSLALAAFFFTVSISLSVLTTFVLMGLSAGRIWWLAGGARKLVGRKAVDNLESGALYCVGGIAFVIIAAYEVSDRIQFNTTTSGAILAQLVGIAPTIIVVRVGLGQSIESTDSFGTPSHAGRARRQLQSAVVPAAAHSTKQPTIYLHADYDKAEAV